MEKRPTVPGLFLPLMILAFNLGALKNTANPVVLQLGPNGNTCGITVPRDPQTGLGLIVWFHGGMRSSVRDRGSKAHRALLPLVDTNRYCLASPSAFAGQDWLTPQGIENIRNLIAYMLNTYPIDKNDINLAGVSDGCLAVIHYSQKADHPIKRRLLFSSFPGLVVNERDVREQKKLSQGSWHFFQGGKDRLFPGDRVLPLLRYWEETVPNTHIHWYPEGLHDFSYYAEHADQKIKRIFSAQ